METQGWRFGGGLNLVRDAISRHKAAGELVGCMNYESREEGYRRIDGYERFDGRKAPSNIADDPPGQEEVETEKRRALITAVPGDRLLAVWRYRDSTYAFSRTGDVTSMYGSSPTGWQLIDFGYKVAFTAGTGAALQPGDTVSNAGSDSATVVGLYVTDGEWGDSGDAEGVLVLRYTGSGRFAAEDVATAGDATTVTLSAVPAAQSVGTGEDFRFANYNFFATQGHERMYGLSGTGKPFEYDGTMFLELDTGVPLETASPSRLAVHQNRLFVGYPPGAVSFSDLGDPRSFDALTGSAGEIGIGDQLTEIIGGFRDRMFLFGRNKTVMLLGTTSANFETQVLSEEAGAMAHTAVLMDEPLVLDDRGIRNISATEAFGDFSIATISEAVRPLLDFKRDGNILPVAAIRLRRKSQYRLFFSDGDCLTANFIRRGRGVTVEFTRFAYDAYDSNGATRIGVLQQVCSVEDDDGRERVFFVLQGSMFVYEMDRGKSFDGRPIPYYLRTPYNDFKSPFMIKRFKKLLIEVDSVLESRFSLAADYDDDREIGERGIESVVAGPSSFWTESDWDAFYWNEVPIRKAEQRIRGRGRNISVSLYSIPDKVEEAHVVTGVTVYFDLRRMKR